ncbi:conserved Plasmodium protein, unknown function [Plasmodium knowlesi strain H]|uniref:Uncharacterized protein n=3 Tax=Plasmodium knowlesi TaxID=5850 RepID=A0A5K1UN59_PLAKH|nr:conserved protein, unknown function [Plasmodium knowlesi strain H]OTN64198.1 Uncharacterized protein PKNOH_S140246900 [Plasmodium knowlesi]CAA9990888.1 conserved protein, unknown function [Plasmodium knowlesi strain H]SBO20888.1 conserved Plasmodium protein, unknown function [Plasmodium knowlesi strain H]SBO21347.1 conserved Plasmodium protein, unknown function [Plasmodium knowlesi strain H]VVS80362.1 conserved protein, unknown function [Plasmodium knowlesi strain H]|eukprot:XP_002262174.1 hypothetical protein, conserved in Plasmodium species [Plasmodium knowlesi strain H]
MNNVIICFLLLINYGKSVLGAEAQGKNPNNDNNPYEESEIDEKWRLHELETNPFIDLKHPNFNGDFIRCIDEYYVYETKEYNAYKKERYKNIKNYKTFKKKQFNCAINLLVHGRPNSRNSNDYKIWSAAANINKHQAMLQKKYSKYIIYTPFVSLSNVTSPEGLYTHLNYAYLLSNRMAITFKNMLEDDTCYNYDIFIHSHCYGANIVRLMFTLDNEIWKTLDKSLLNVTYEREVLAILEDNFKLTLKDINIITDKNAIQIRKDPYFKIHKYYLYKTFQSKFNKNKIIEDFDDVFDDHSLKYNFHPQGESNAIHGGGGKGSMENLVAQSGTSGARNAGAEESESEQGEREEPEESEESEDSEDSDSDDEFIFFIKPKKVRKKGSHAPNRSLKRLHTYLLNKKFTLLSIVSTAPPLIGIVSNMEDIRVGHQKLMKYKFMFQNVPSFLRAKMLKTRDAQELLHVVNPGLLCLLALHEKLNYNYENNTGSLISYFKNVNYYADLDNDEIMSLHTSLGLHSTLHMRNLSYYLLNIRNEYHHRTYSLPAHLSDINVSNNYAFFEYIKENDVCSQIKHSELERFVSYLSEIINFNQEPQPYIPHRQVYKNPFMSHYVIPYMQENNIYTPHSILGTGRTALLLFSYDIYKHIAMNGFSERNVIKNDIDFLYDADPFVYYNWMTYIGNQNELDEDNFVKNFHIYSDNINMNMVQNLFNLFVSTHYVKFFIFSKNNTADVYRSLHRTLKNFSLPINKVVLRRQREKKINFPLLNNAQFDHEENVVYDYMCRYTNFLKTFSYLNSFQYITNEEFILNHKNFKKYQSERMAELKNEIKKAHNFIQQNSTFSDMKNKLTDMYNIENTANSSERELEVNEEVGNLNTFESANYPLEESKKNSASNDSLQDIDKSYVTYHGIYVNIRRTMTLKEAFKSISMHNDIYDAMQYVEFVIKGSAYNDVEDHLNNMEDVNSCLFNKNENIPLNFISKFCNYDQQAYFHIKKLYTSRNLFVLKSLKQCNYPKYRNLKLCENRNLLKTFFQSDLSVTLSKLHEREKKRMATMRDGIERGMNEADILSISNDSLAAIFHNKNEDISTFKMNACFIIPEKPLIQNLFSNDENMQSTKEDTEMGTVKKVGHGHITADTSDVITMTESSTNWDSSLSNMEEVDSSRTSLHSLESLGGYEDVGSDVIEAAYELEREFGPVAKMAMSVVSANEKEQEKEKEKEKETETEEEEEEEEMERQKQKEKEREKKEKEKNYNIYAQSSASRSGRDSGSGEKVFCTEVTLPVLLRKDILKSANDIYMRAIRSVMQDPHFRSAFNLRNGDEPYESFIYFFDKFAYVYNQKNKYAHTGDINTFNTPQNIKWNYFYYLLKYGSQTNYNSESFLKNFFYGKKSNLVKPQKDNILKDFLAHFTVFFYLFKLD